MNTEQDIISHKECAISYHQCCGSGMFIPDPRSDFFPSWILDPGSELFSSRIPDPHQRMYFSQKKWLLSSKKYDLGCSSRISDPAYGSCLFTYPGSRIQGSKRHRIPDPDPQNCPSLYILLTKRVGNIAPKILHDNNHDNSGLITVTARICKQGDPQGVRYVNITVKWKDNCLCIFTSRK
jgi:hypothetical protein